MKQQAAVLGVGQTQHRARRRDVSIAGLCREAVDRALADAGRELADIDAVVAGKAPDLFEGVMMPELYLADALGATGKPLLRVHTAGSVGGATGIVAASLVQAGLHRRVLAVAFEKQSESNAMWALSIAPPTEPAVCTRSSGLPVAPSASARYSSGIITPSNRSGAFPATTASMSASERPASPSARSTASRHRPAIDTSVRRLRCWVWPTPRTAARCRVTAGPP